jgi:LysM repeat protein
MSKPSSQREIIEEYMSGKSRRFPLTAGDILTFVIFGLMILAVAYLLWSGQGKLFAPPTPTATPTITASPTAEPILTATLAPSATHTPPATITATATSTPLVSQTPSITPTETTTPTTTASATSTRPPRTYTVQLNDSLSGIAARFGVTLEALQTANNISDPSLIVIGQVLIIPDP